MRYLLLQCVTEPYYATLRQALSEAINQAAQLESMQRLQQEIIAGFGEGWCERRDVNLQSALQECVISMMASLVCILF